VNIAPLCVAPWQPALMHADLVIPCFMELAAQGIPFVHFPAGPPAQVLNQAGDYLLDHPEYTHLVNLDIDHTHRANVVHKLAAACGMYDDIKIVGGINFQRPEPHTPCAWRLRDGEIYNVTGWMDGLVEEVVKIGFGCVMIAREVFEAIERPWFMYDYTDASPGVYPGPDMYFCKKATAAGFSIWCDYSITSPHIAYKLIDEDTWNEQKQ